MIPDGIHFGLPEADYHADDALGSGDIKRLLINPVGFWANTPRGKQILIDLGLAKEESEDEEQSLSQLFGTACHVKVLEPHRFDALYTEKEDMPVDYLATKEQIGDELRQIGAYLPPSGASRTEYVMAAKRAGLKVSDDWKMDELMRAEGRDILSKRWCAQLNMIDHLLNVSHPALEGRSIREDSLSDGYPEVSVFWTDENGVRFKARFDWMRRAAIVDLKTYGCPADKAPVSFFLGQIAQYGYDLQRVAYIEAWSQLKRLIPEGRVFGEVDPAWLKRVRVDREPLWRWVAVQTLGMPEIDWVDWHASMAGMSAEGQRREAVAAFILYQDRFGMDTPWAALRGRIVVDDTTLDATGVARRMMSRGEQTWTASQ